MKARILAVSLLVLTLAGCGANSTKRGYFYVASTSNGYKVASDDEGKPFTRYYTKGLSVYDANTIADKLNQDLPASVMADSDGK